MLSYYYEFGPRTVARLSSGSPQRREPGSSNVWRRPLIRQFIGVRAQPFGSSGLTRDFPAIREQLTAGIATGDVKVENARLDEILIAMLNGE